MIRLVHGTPDGVGQLTKTFATAHAEAFVEKKCSKAAVQRLLKDPAFCVRETRDGYKAPRRFVCAEVLQKYGFDGILDRICLFVLCLTPRLARDSGTAFITVLIGDSMPCRYFN